MSNKKLSRLLEPNLKLYFFFMAIFAVATFIFYKITFRKENSLDTVL